MILMIVWIVWLISVYSYKCVFCPVQTMCSMSTRTKKEMVVNAECKCQEHVATACYIGGKFVAIFGNVAKIITLREGECSWKCLLQWCLWVMLVHHSMAIHCSHHVPRPPTLLRWCTRLFLSRRHTLRSGCETTATGSRRHGSITQPSSVTQHSLQFSSLSPISALPPTPALTPHTRFSENVSHCNL